VKLRKSTSPAFFGLRARPGQVLRRRIPVATWPDGSPLTLPLIVHRGRRAGPVLYVQGGLHGDELIGVEAARRVTLAVKSQELSGTLVAVPIANPPAFLSRQRGWPGEARGPIDMNRVCPGNASGALTERIAAALFENVLRQADYCLDFHGGMTGSSEAPFAQLVVLDDPHHTLRSRRLMAEAFGTELIYEMRPRERQRHTVFRGLERSFAEQARLAGVPTLVVELGEGGRLNENLIQLAVEGVLNVMRALGMLPGSPRTPERRFRFEQVAIRRPERGGALVTRVRPGDRVKEGAPVGEISDGLRVVEKLTSPATGVVLRVATAAVTEPGADVLWVAEARKAKRR
jgi:predicted deacylase